MTLEECGPLGCGYSKFGSFKYLVAIFALYFVFTLLAMSVYLLQKVPPAVTEFGCYTLFNVLMFAAFVACDVRDDSFSNATPRVRRAFSVSRVKTNARASCARAKTTAGPLGAGSRARGRARRAHGALGSIIRRDTRNTHHAAPSTENPIAAAIPSAAKK